MALLAKWRRGLAQLSNAKFLGEAHYIISHSLYGNYGYGSTVGGSTGLTPLASYKSRVYHFLYQSTQLSERLAINFLYSAQTVLGTPSAIIRLRSTTGSSYNSTVIDSGIKFENGIHIDSTLIGDGSIARSLFTGCELIQAPTNTIPESPRPLYVPLANRGQLLNIEIEVNDVALGAIHIYDIFNPEISI